MPQQINPAIAMLLAGAGNYGTMAAGGQPPVKYDFTPQPGYGNDPNVAYPAIGGPWNNWDGMGEEAYKNPKFKQGIGGDLGMIGGNMWPGPQPPSLGPAISGPMPPWMNGGVPDIAKVGPDGKPISAIGMGPGNKPIFPGDRDIMGYGDNDQMKTPLGGYPRLSKKQGVPQEPKIDEGWSPRQSMPKPARQKPMPRRGMRDFRAQRPWAMRGQPTQDDVMQLMMQQAMNNPRGAR